METPAWLGALDHIASVLIPLGTFVLGKAMKGGANQIALDRACKDVEDLQILVKAHTLTLVEHSGLHRGYVDAQRAQQTQLLEVDRKVNLICGHLRIEGVR